MNEKSSAYWNISVEDSIQAIQTHPEGLTGEEARQRLEIFGFNRLKPKKSTATLALLLSQFKSPIILVLIFAAILSFFLRDRTNAIIILTIVIISGLLGFWQERGAVDAMKKLLAIVQTKAVLWRDKIEQEIPVDEVVPGDMTVLSAGAMIPGDCVIVESKDLFVDEAVLTGESFPVEKTNGVLPVDTSLAKRTNCLFMGTHVVSGSAKALVVNTGLKTEFGKIFKQLKLRPPESDFEHGIRHFGYFLLEVTLMLIILIFAFNVYFHRPIIDALLFSLALAVGLTPQLLPAIIGINLSHGSRRMAEKKVIVKRLTSIENFGTMDVLCFDKTGTLTEGKIQLYSAIDARGNESEKLLKYAYLNAIFETGLINPIDEAIRNYRKFDTADFKKLDEIPYDFIRKRLSVLAANADRRLMVTKGALRNMIDICSRAEYGDGQLVDIETVYKPIEQQYEDLSKEGFRTLGVAYRELTLDTDFNKDQEKDMIFLGFLVLRDPPKPRVIATLGQLKKLGIEIKIITGDNRYVAAYVSKQIGIQDIDIFTGSELRKMSDEALIKQVQTANVFAEVEPNQKERIILALKKAGNVVGFMGDGINDASALHAADVGISVDSAVDVAKEAADIVLLEKELDVLVQGVQEGRKTFANTMKYVFMATSANFGNMFSMACASLFLPFLPLLPKQILLTNLMTDIPEMTIATDDVDRKLVEKPQRWNIKFIRNFMAIFGLLSSIFDFLTFGLLLLMLKATREQFRTGWFMESVISAILIVWVIRTRRPFFKNPPRKYLLGATLFILILSLILPYTPLSSLFGFTQLKPYFLLPLAAIVLIYIAAAELTKQIFFKQAKT
jgi:Mg2+-importing ATPase